MRTIRPSMARLAFIASIALFIVGCAGSASAPSGAPALDDAYSGYGQAAGENARPAGRQRRTDAGRVTEDGVGAAVDDARIIRTGTIELEVKRCRHRARDRPQRHPRAWAATSERPGPRTSTTGRSPDHVSDPGRPLGGRARSASWSQRPDHQGRHGTDRSRRGDRPGHRPRGADPQPALERDGAPADRRRRGTDLGRA